MWAASDVITLYCALHAHRKEREPRIWMLLFLMFWVRDVTSTCWMDKQHSLHISRCKTKVCVCQKVKGGFDLVEGRCANSLCARASLFWCDHFNKMCLIAWRRLARSNKKVWNINMFLFSQNRKSSGESSGEGQPIIKNEQKTWSFKCTLVNSVLNCAFDYRLLKQGAIM